MAWVCLELSRAQSLGWDPRRGEPAGGAECEGQEVRWEHTRLLKNKAKLLQEGSEAFGDRIESRSEGAKNPPRSDTACARRLGSPCCGTPLGACVIPDSFS